MNLHSFCKTVLVGSMLGLLITPTFSAAQESHPPHWTYSGPESPEQWGKLDPAYSLCSQGRMQSPMDVKNAKPAASTLKTDDDQVMPWGVSWLTCAKQTSHDRPGCCGTSRTFVRRSAGL